MTAVDFDRAAWLAARRAGLGGSDLAKLIPGLTPPSWGGEMSVWASKTEGLDGPDNERMAWGRRLERPVLEAYAEEAGVVLLGAPGLLAHPEHPIMMGSLDELAGPATPVVEASIEADRVVEAKTTNAFATGWGEPGTAEIPNNYGVQAQCYLGLAHALYGITRCDVAVLRGGQELGIYTLEFDPEVYGHLVEVGERFWRDHVVTRIPPALDGSDAAGEWLARKFPRVERKERVEGNVELDGIADELRVISKQLEGLEARKAALRQNLSLAIAEADGARGAWGSATYRVEAGKPSWKSYAISLGGKEKCPIVGEGSRVLRTRFAGEDD